MRVVVIGGGIIGLLCAHHLRKRGAEVVVVERDRVGAGCSSGNAGWVTPSISLPLPAPGLRLKSLAWMLRADSPLYIRPTTAPRMAGWLWSFWKHCNAADFERGARAFAALGSETMKLYDELAADGAVFESRADGLLMVFRRQADLEEELELLERFGYGPVRTVVGEELHALEPALDRAIAFGGHVVPERVVRPEDVCSATAGLITRSGGEILEGSRVAALALAAGRVRAAVLDSGDHLEGDAFLIATGAEAARLSTAAGAPLPIQAGKGYSITIDRPRLELRYPLYLGDAMIGVTPFAGALRVAGTMELSGVNRRLDPRRIAALERGASRDVPGVLAGAARRDWVGMRPLAPDGLPILGALSTAPNLYVATGHQMLGVTLAPSTGKAMAELILEGRSEVDLEPFSALRFGRR
jgi:D-amino-acid dehydrogenase